MCLSSSLLLFALNRLQNEILEKIRRAEEEANQMQAMHNLDKITIHCKECSALVCKASELRRKGNAGHVTCISPKFKRWVKEVKYRKPQRYRDTETMGESVLIAYGCYSHVEFKGGDWLVFHLKICASENQHINRFVLKLLMKTFESFLSL